MEFNAPAAEIEGGEIIGGNGRLGQQQSGHQGDGLGAKAGLGNGVAHDPHGNALGPERKFLGRHPSRTFCGTLPDGAHIEVRRLGKWGSGKWGSVCKNEFLLPAERGRKGVAGGSENSAGDVTAPVNTTDDPGGLVAQPTHITASAQAQRKRNLRRVYPVAQWSGAGIMRRMPPATDPTIVLTEKSLTGIGGRQIWARAIHE